MQTNYITKLLNVPSTAPKCALVGGLKLTKIEHIANTRKLQYYVDLQNRDKNKLEVKMQKLQERKNMPYEKEINELKEKYSIDISMKGENSQAIKNHIKNKILEINDKELEEEIKIGKKTKMMNEVNRKYLENFNFE